MNKAELIRSIAEKEEITIVEATARVDSVLSGIVDGLHEDGEVKLNGFGNFVVKERAARQARNPQSNEIIDVPAKRVPTWKPAKSIKESF